MVKNVRFDWNLSIVQKYHLLYAGLLTSVPVVCILVLTVLLVMFAKLNLYFLESNGLLINPMIREGYYGQVLLEILSVSWYFSLLVLFTFVLSFIVMNWAVSPFKNAEILLRTALEKPDQLKSQPRWLSESLVFDKLLWNFAEQVRSGKAQSKNITDTPRLTSNLPFLGKFIFIFTLVSFMTGYIMGIFFNTIYDKIVSLALQLVSAKDIRGHYFLAQEEILNDAVMLMIVLSFMIYVIIGRNISSYMGTMIFVFSKAIKNQSFPIRLRNTDIYFPLADAINASAQKLDLLSAESQQNQK